MTLLQTGKPYLADALAREAGVSRRTLFRDLQQLKLAGIPLLYNGSERRYTIAQSFFLPPVNFTVPEVLGLMMLVQKLGGQLALPNFESVATAMMKIESMLPLEIRDYCGSALDRIDVRPGPMSHVREPSDAFHLLWQAAQHGEVVEIGYDANQDEGEAVFRIHPYHLMFISRGWYVIAHSRRHGEVRTFKIDRVRSVRLTGESFRKDPSFDPVAYLGNAWQMIPGDRRYQVRIRFSPKVARNVEEVRWHATQRTRRAGNGSLLFEAEVDGVGEIAWWVLGYGSEAVVESPEELRAVIRKHARAMADAYGDP